MNPFLMFVSGVAFAIIVVDASFAVLWLFLNGNMKRSSLMWWSFLFRPAVISMYVLIASFVYFYWVQP